MEEKSIFLRNVPCSCLLSWSDIVLSFSEFTSVRVWVQTLGLWSRVTAKLSPPINIFPFIAMELCRSCFVTEHSEHVYWCCFLVHYWFCCFCTLPSWKRYLAEKKISDTSFEIYQLHEFWLMCLSVCMCISLLVISKILYQYLYHYIVFWYIYECVMKKDLRGVSYLRCETISTRC